MGHPRHPALGAGLGIQHEVQLAGRRHVEPDLRARLLAAQLGRAETGQQLLRPRAEQRGGAGGRRLGRAGGGQGRQGGGAGRGQRAWRREAAGAGGGGTCGRARRGRGRRGGRGRRAGRSGGAQRLQARAMASEPGLGGLAGVPAARAGGEAEQKPGGAGGAPRRRTPPRAMRRLGGDQPSPGSISMLPVMVPPSSTESLR